MLAAPETSVAAGGGIGGAALDKTKRRPWGYEVPVGFHRNKITSPKRCARRFVLLTTLSTLDRKNGQWVQNLPLVAPFIALVSSHYRFFMIYFKATIASLQEY